jgi:beta-lactam-binding protein with PASTA domain
MLLPVIAIALMIGGCSTGPAPITSPATSSGAPAQRQSALRVVPDGSKLAPDAITESFVAKGFVVELVDSSGSQVTDPDDWKFISQSPKAGTRSPAGVKITVTLSPPAPPTPRDPATQNQLSG